MIGLKGQILLHNSTYKIIRQISSGGFGITYEAEHVMLQKRVAIKEFFVKDFCNRDDSTSHVTVGTQSKVALVGKLKKKFIDEAIAIGKLDHPNIVKVTDVFEDNGTAYYVMDFIDGPSLADMVKRNGKLPEKKALKYILQVADALKYVHAQNRLHLDIKPGNIMVDSKDNAILIDFGASKQYDEENGENTSTLLGKTPGYAPIEQMGNTVQKFTPATDIYALGATLYKLVTGITPPEATVLASGEELAPMGREVSEDTQSAILQAMQLNKAKRPQSVDAFVDVLKSVRKRKTSTKTGNGNSRKKAKNVNENTIVDLDPVKEKKEPQQTVPNTNSNTHKEVPQQPQSHQSQVCQVVYEEDEPNNNRKIIVVAVLIISVIVALVFFTASNNSQSDPKRLPLRLILTQP